MSLQRNARGHAQLYDDSGGHRQLKHGGHLRHRSVCRLHPDACSAHPCSRHTVQRKWTQHVCKDWLHPCHTPSFTTGRMIRAAPRPSRALRFPIKRRISSPIFSSTTWARPPDGITQGGAGPDEFRTAPLWGVGQRVFFLHDGRTTNLVEAIRDHKSRGSEANKVIERFDKLTLRSSRRSSISCGRSSKKNLLNPSPNPGRKRDHWKARPKSG